MPDNVCVLTITLTGRAPVKITKDEWPVLAQARDSFQPRAGVEDRYDLKIRQHTDGRSIVYAVFVHATEWEQERDFNIRAGELLDKDADVIVALQRIVGDIIARLNAEEMRSGVFLRLMEECIADLPAQSI